MESNSVKEVIDSFGLIFDAESKKDFEEVYINGIHVSLTASSSPPYVAYSITDCPRYTGYELTNVSEDKLFKAF